MGRSQGLAGGPPDPRHALPGTAPRYAADRPATPVHLRLELALDLAARTAAGRATTTWRALADDLRAVAFDAVGFRGVVARDAAGRRLHHRYDGRRLTVALPRALAAGETAAVRVDYRVVRPPLGLHFLRPDRAYPDRPVQVWSQSHDEHARYWFPCHDAPGARLTSEVLATVPAGFVAVSNGRLLARRAAGGGRVTWHWRLRAPHSPYLVSLAVGRFEVRRERWRGIPLTYYCERGRAADMRRALGRTPRALAFYSRALGLRYPYEGYAQVAVADFVHGGMEHTSATTLTDAYLHGPEVHREVEPAATGLMAHELAHQWFGDLLGCRDWSHAWLSEAFATYAEALFTEHERGRDDFALEMWRNAAAYFEEDRDRYRRPLVTNLWRQPADLFDRHLYEKGACVLHMLRQMLGDRAFWRALRHYVRQHRGGLVETTDLVVAVEEATGRNVRRFIDQWVHGAGHPELRVRYWWDRRRRAAHMVVRQTQRAGDGGAPFALPFEVEVHWGRRGRRRFREAVDGAEHRFAWRLPAEPRMVRVDPDHWLLARWDVGLPPGLWRAQLAEDPHPVGRIQAAQALGRLASADATAWLGAALRREAHWAVQAEIAAALGQVRTAAAEAALLGALDLPDPRARRGVAAGLAETRSARAGAALRRLADTDPSPFVVAEALRGLGRTRDPGARPVLLAALRARDAWNDVVRTGAVDGLADLGGPAALAVLRARTRYGHPHPSRVAAVAALGRAGAGDPGALRTLLARTRDPHLRVRTAAIRALGALGDERALPRLRALAAARDVDGRVPRAAAEAVRAIAGEAPGAGRPRAAPASGRGTRG